MSNELEHPDPEVLAALYISGGLTDEEYAAVDDAVAAGRDDIAAQIGRLQSVGEALGAIGGVIAPDPELRGALLRDVADGVSKSTSGSGHTADDPQVWRDWSDSDDHSLLTIHAGDGAWEETGIEGIAVRRLFVDQANNRMTAMFKMAPGTSYVPHRHDGAEECYVIEGDLHVGDEMVLRAGDYQRCPAGSMHGVQRTEGGCVLLINSSLSDEVA